MRNTCLQSRRCRSARAKRWRTKEFDEKHVSAEPPVPLKALTKLFRTTTAPGKAMAADLDKGIGEKEGPPFSLIITKYGLKPLQALAVVVKRQVRLEMLQKAVNTIRLVQVRRGSGCNCMAVVTRSHPRKACAGRHH